MYMQARQLVDTVTMTQNWLREGRYVIYDNFVPQQELSYNILVSYKLSMKFLI